MNTKVEVKNLNFSYGTHLVAGKKALNEINLSVFENKITSLIGPSGCGKSTLLRCFNRMHDLYGKVAYSGQIILHPSSKNDLRTSAQDVLSHDTDPLELRMKVGMVFQKPSPFPQSIFENIAFGLRLRGKNNKTYLKDKVEDALKKAGIWSEVHDRLQTNAVALSGGQQQRICIARALAVDPELLLLDEPTSALDPISTAHIEELIATLKNNVTILMVTHNLHQAARSSDYTAFMYMGDLVEFGESSQIFTNPKNERTENYITGRFG